MTASLRAISGDTAFLARLRSGAFAARVHSVFDSVVNVCGDSDGRLFTLACAHSDNAPATLVVDTPSFAHHGLRPGAPVASSGVTLWLRPALEISLDSARAWSAALPARPEADIPLGWLQEFIEREGVCGGVKPGPRHGNALEAQTSQLLGEATAALGAALRADQREAAYEQAGRLVGLGPGLTPSGDDYLLGLATAYAMAGDGAREHRRLLTRVIEDNGHRTNAISHTAMAHAARGCVRESIVDFARAITRRDLPALERRARRVIAIGATSGTDIMLGMQAGFGLNHGMRGH